MKADKIVSHAMKLPRLHAAVNDRRPENGFITTAYIEAGWTAQPDYSKERK